MNLSFNFIKLNKMADDISYKLYDMYVDYLNSGIDFPYEERNILIDGYDLFYVKVYKNKNSNINKLLFKINILDNDCDLKYNAPSKDLLLLQVSQKTFCYILFFADRYIPYDMDSKEIIFNKLFPIIINLKVSNIVELYSKIKKCAIIRGVVLNYDSESFLQEMFVSFIMFVFSRNADKDFCYMKSRWTFEEVCQYILKEPILYRNNLVKKISLK